MQFETPFRVRRHRSGGIMENIAEHLACFQNVGRSSFPGVHGRSRPGAASIVKIFGRPLFGVCSENYCELRDILLQNRGKPLLIFPLHYEFLPLPPHTFRVHSNALEKLAVLSPVFWRHTPLGEPPSAHSFSRPETVALGTGDGYA
jgi:hypothetical protein